MGQDNGNGQRPILQVRWGSEAALTTIYANRFAILPEGNEIFIVCGEQAIPVTLADPAMAELAEVPEYVEIKPVAKLAITAAALEELQKVIEERLQLLLPDPA